ncbi:unnamed protein product [Effrenium voratum]|nr:unnamed protein product [Effrenium voratum]
MDPTAITRNTSPGDREAASEAIAMVSRESLPAAAPLFAGSKLRARPDSSCAPSPPGSHSPKGLRHSSRENSERLTLSGLSLRLFGPGKVPEIEWPQGEWHLETEGAVRNADGQPAMVLDAFQDALRAFAKSEGKVSFENFAEVASRGSWKMKALDLFAQVDLGQVPQLWPGGYVAMKSFVMKSCLLLSVGAAGMKLQEPADCVGDLIGGTEIFQCDEQKADDTCAKKYTLAAGDVYTQCGLSGPNCLALGPACKKPSAASLTCSTLSECEGKGWKRTWTSGTDTSYLVPLGTYVMLGFIERTGDLSHSWFFKTPDSWKTTHPYKLQHQGDIIEAIRASDGKTYEGELVSDSSNYGGGCECGKGGGSWGRICMRSKTPPAGGWRCTGKGGAVPEEIDFPYVRGYGDGNSCGSSSLSYYNWNAGTNFCNNGYKVLIMTK